MTTSMDRFRILKLPIKPMLHRHDEAWGLTESHQLRPHLQSFFCCSDVPYSKNQNSERFPFRSKKKQPHRQAVIEHYELGLLRALLAAGIRLKALIPADINRRSLCGQPMLNWHLALSSIQLGLPVLKRKLCRMS